MEEKRATDPRLQKAINTHFYDKPALIVNLRAWIANEGDVHPEDLATVNRLIGWAESTDQTSVHDPDVDIFDLHTGQARYRARTRGEYEEQRRDGRARSAKSFWSGR